MLEIRIFAACTVLAVHAAPALAQFGPPTLDELDLAVGLEADGPRSAALTPDGALLLIAHRESDNVTFFDTAAGQVVDTVAVGDGPVHVAISPDGGRAVVCNAAGNSVSLIDVASRALTATLAVGAAEPYRAEITSDSARALVGQIGNGQSCLSVIDLALGVEVTSFPTVPQGKEYWVGGDRYGSFELLPGDQTVLVPSFYGGNVTVYDVATGQPQQVIPMMHVTDLELSADGSRAVLLSAFPQSIPQLTVIDLATWTPTQYGTGNYSDFGFARVAFSPNNSAAVVVATYTTIINLATGVVTFVQEGGEDACISFDGQYTLVTGQDDRVLDTVSGLELARFPGAVHTVTVPAAQGYAAYSIGGYDEFVAAYDLQAAALSTRVPTGEGLELDGPTQVELMADGRSALVACQESNNVAIVDLVERSVVGVLPAANAPWRIVADPLGLTAVSLELVPRRVTVFNLLQGSNVGSVPLPVQPVAAVYDPGGLRVWVRGYEPGAQLQPLFEVAVGPGGGVLVSTTLIDIGPPDHLRTELLLSPDGATLALTSATGELVVIDAATRTIIGDFDGAYTQDMVFDGADRLLTSAASVGTNQFTIQGQTVTQGPPLSQLGGNRLALDGDRLLVVSSFSTPFAAILDANTGSVGPLAFFSGLAEAAHLSGAHAFVRTGDQLLHYVEEFGALDLVSSSPTGEYGSGFAFSSYAGLAVTTAHDQDVLSLFDFGDLPTSTYCDQTTANSLGQFGEIEATGTFFAGGAPIELTASNMPPGRLGYFLGSLTQGFLVNPGGSMGNLCVVGNVARFAQSIQTVNTSGRFSITVDTLAIPTSPAQAVQSGDTWHFQAWYRDQNPGATSAFTNAVSVPFR